MQNTLLESAKWKVWRVVCCHPWIKIDCIRTMMFSLKVSFWFQICFESTIPITIEKLKVDKLTSLTPAYNSLAVVVYKFLRTQQTKFFNISTEYMKYVNKFWVKYIQKSVSYLNLFTDFNLFWWCITRNQLFCPSQPAQ